MPHERDVTVTCVSCGLKCFVRTATLQLCSEDQDVTSVQNIFLNFVF
jgi:hypothetical protein